MMHKNILSDLKAGSVVFLVALPLCLGIAMACGAPLHSGISAGVIGGIVVTFFSDAKFSVSGPAAGLTSVVITSIATLGSIEVFIAAIVMAGLLQILLGLIRAGSIGNFIPNAVIKGMLAGIGIILIIKQIPHFVGYDADFEGDINFAQPDGHNTISDLYYMMNYINPGSIIIGLVSFVIIVISEIPGYRNNKYLTFLPGPLLAVIAGIILTLIFEAVPFLSVGPDHLVKLPEIRSASDIGSLIMVPQFSQLANSAFWICAVTIAAVASLETLLNIEAIEKLDPEKTPVNSNRELVAQGIGNTLSGLIGGLPITSVIVRSSANIYAGARTRLSIVIHAILLLVCVLFIPGVLGLIPNSSLAVILILTGYKLAKVSLFRRQFKMGWDQFVPFVVTIVVMLLTDLLKGVGAGIVVAVIYIIRVNIRSTVEVIEEEINGQFIYLIKLPQHLTFFNKGFMIKSLSAVRKNSSVIIDGSNNKVTDKDVREVLLDFYSSSQNKNIEIQFVKYQI
jgi:MFS superfamily sulfate permease-like transporter